MNQIILMGYATDKPTFREKEGVQIARFSLGITTKTGEDTQESVFIVCRIVGKRAKVASEVIQKGSRLLVNGRLSCMCWEENGEKRSMYYVFVKDIQYLCDADIARLKEYSKDFTKSWKF